MGRDQGEIRVRREPHPPGRASHGAGGASMTTLPLWLVPRKKPAALVVFCKTAPLSVTAVVVLLGVKVPRNKPLERVKLRVSLLGLALVTLLLSPRMTSLVYDW